MTEMLLLQGSAGSASSPRNELVMRVELDLFGEEAVHVYHSYHIKDELKGMGFRYVPEIDNGLDLVLCTTMSARQPWPRRECSTSCNGRVTIMQRRPTLEC